MPNRVRLPQKVTVKAPGLLPVMLMPVELADELEVPVAAVLEWLAAGAPHHRDESGQTWINAAAFSHWVYSQRKVKASGRKLRDNEAYCMRCKQAVPLIDPVVRPGKGKQILIRGECPRCGIIINRGGRSCG